MSQGPPVGNELFVKGASFLGQIQHSRPNLRFKTSSVCTSCFRASTNVEFIEMLLSNCSRSLCCLLMWMFKYFMDVLEKSQTSQEDNFSFAPADFASVSLDSRKCFLLLSFLLWVEGLVFFLVTYLTGAPTLVSKEKEKVWITFSWCLFSLASFG